VQPGSPAAKAGLRERDVIIALNGRAIRSAAELRARLGLTAVGEEVELRVLRAGHPLSIRVRVGAPEQMKAAEGQAVPQLPGLRAVEIERGTPLDQRVQGLIVAGVDQGSRAWHAGFRTGDIIYAVGQRRVRTYAELVAALRKAERGLTDNHADLIARLFELRAARLRPAPFGHTPCSLERNGPRKQAELRRRISSGAAHDHRRRGARSFA
jgi:S1-C subfamily serine protease